MKSRRFADRILYSMSALLAVGGGASLTYAFGPDDRAPTGISQHHQYAHDSKKAGELVKLVREATSRYRDVRVAEGSSARTTSCTRRTGMRSTGRTPDGPARSSCAALS